MRSICVAATEAVKPHGIKTTHKVTAYLEDAAQQVAKEWSQGHLATPSEIKDHLRSLSGYDLISDYETDDEYGWNRPIQDIVFVPADETKGELDEAFDYDVIVVRWQVSPYTTGSLIRSLDYFARKVKEYLA